MYYDSSIRERVKENRDFLQRSYLVTMRDHTKTNEDGTQEQQLVYCGLARTWEGKCEDAKFVCSTPGPVFDVLKDEAIYVVWRNEIKSYNFDLLGNNLPNICYNSTADELYGKPHRCFPHQKKKGFEEFTYYEPTDLRDQYDSIE